MSEIELYDYFGRGVRIVMRDGDPWFVASDVCAALGVARPQDSVRHLDEDEKGRCPLDTPSGEQEVLIVSEAGLYSLILRSRRPEAKKFKRWVTHDLLPTVRQTGRYQIERRPTSELDILRRAIDQIEEAQQRAARAEKVAIEATQDARVANARIDAMEGRHNWFSALGYAIDNGMPTDSVSLARFGKLAASIARADGIEPNKVQHSHFGKVNEFPLHVWDRARQAMGGAA